MLHQPCSPETCKLKTHPEPESSLRTLSPLALKSNSIKPNSTHDNKSSSICKNNTENQNTNHTVRIVAVQTNGRLRRAAFRKH